MLYDFELYQATLERTFIEGTISDSHSLSHANGKNLKMSNN